MRQTYRGVLSNPSLIVSSPNEALAAPTALPVADLASTGAGAKRSAEEPGQLATAGVGAAGGQAPKGKKRKGGAGAN